MQGQLRRADFNRRDKVIAALQRKVRTEPAKANNTAELAHLQKRLNELDRKVAALYGDKVCGIVSGQAFTLLLREYECEFHWMLGWLKTR